MMFRFPGAAATFGLAFCLAVFSSARADTSGEAAEFVSTHGDEMLAILDKPSGVERREEFGHWLNDVFDLETLASLALGPYKQSATPEQLDAYRQAFADYIVVTYEARFDAFTGYTFEVGQARPANNNDVVVRTSVIDPAGKPVLVDFRVRDESGKLQVIDVAVEGLSMLKTQRDEFSSVIQRNGLDGLVASLNQHVANVIARD